MLTRSSSASPGARAARRAAACCSTCRRSRSASPRSSPSTRSRATRSAACASRRARCSAATSRSRRGCRTTRVRSSYALDSLRREGVGLAQVSTFASMALVQRTGRTRLAQIRAVTAGYPFYGEIITSPAGAVGHLHAGTRRPRRSVAARRARRARRRHARARPRAFVIAGTLVSVPGDVGVTLGDRARASTSPSDTSTRRRCCMFGSRVEHETLLKLTAAAPATAIHLPLQGVASRRRRSATAPPRRRSSTSPRRSTSFATSSASSGSSRCCSAASASRAA